MADKEEKLPPAPAEKPAEAAAEKPAVQPAPAQPSVFEKALDSVDGKAGHVTEQVGDHLYKNAGISRDTTHAAMPVIAGVAAAAAGTFLIQPIQKFAEALGKIPIIGDVLKFIGNIVSYAAPLIAGFLAFRAFGKPVQHFQPAPSTNNLLAGTAAVAQPSEKKEVSVSRKDAVVPEATEKVPMAPAKVVPQPQEPGVLPKEELESADSIPYEELKQRRRKAIEDLDPKKEGAYRKLMLDQHQAFENRLEFVKDAKVFEGEVDKDSPRNHMVKALKERIGLEGAEAEALIVKAPALRTTVYDDGKPTHNHPGGDGISKDGNLPEKLDNFAREFASFYDKPGHSSLTINGKNGVPTTGFTYDDSLSVTQKMEYINAALDKLDERRKFMESKHVRQSLGMAEGGDAIAVDYYDYTDTQKMSSWEYTRYWTGVSTLLGTTHTEGSERYPSGDKTWKAENEFIKKLNGDSVHDLGNLGIVHEDGNELKNVRTVFRGYEQKFGYYLEEVKQAETQHSGEIAKFKGQAQFMEQSLDMIKNKGVALLEKKEIGTQTVIEVRDVNHIDPAKRVAGDSSKQQWTGVLDKNTQIFSISSIHDEKTGRDISLPTPLTVDLKTGAGVEKVLEQSAAKQEPKQDQKTAALQKAAAAFIEQKHSPAKDDALMADVGDMPMGGFTTNLPGAAAKKVEDKNPLLKSNDAGLA